jgi:hypothetical protein
MKKTITILTLFIFGITNAQVVADFESFTLTPGSYYKDTNSVDWQTTNASFQYDWTKSSWGDYWSSGFAYTNIMNPDSGNSRWLYNCAAGKGYNLSNNYVACQPGGFIRVKSPSDGVVGFYVTNTTYAYMSMKNGDAFAKKFGGATGNDPDWFKLTVKGYKNGVLKTDSVEKYLADFRDGNNANDYILKTWQWVDCNKLGAVDSVTFYLYSTDNSFGFMNTPAFFAIDNFTTGQGVGINELKAFGGISVFPNPANDAVNIRFQGKENTPLEISIYSTLGNLVRKENTNFNSAYELHRIELNELSSGSYIVELKSGDQKESFKLIKN